MKLCILFSGGKDSVMTLYRGMQEHEASVLLSMIPERDDSYMFHFPNIRLAEYSARAIGIPVVMKETSGEPTKENADLRDAIRGIKEEYGIEGIGAGAVGVRLSVWHCIGYLRRAWPCCFFPLLEKRPCRAYQRRNRCRF